MGYRDDSTALESRCEALEHELAPRREELRQLTERSARARREIARRRWRRRLLAVRGWVGRHKLLVVVLTIVVGITSWFAIKHWAEEFWRTRRQEQLLDSLGCRAILTVESYPFLPRARVFVGQEERGVTPLRGRVCPGARLVRVVARNALPWQRLVQVPPAGTVAVRAALIPWRPSELPSGGTVAFSEPPGAVAFLDGAEVGRTPVFLPGVATTSVHGHTVAVAAAGFRPLVLQPRPNTVIWFHLPRAGDAAPPPSPPAPARERDAAR